MRARVTLVPHTHWDREWYQPFDAFRDRLVQMMDGLLDLLGRGFPHFHLDGQTAMIDDYLQVRPEREGDIVRLARSGRISVGPWVTQMDEFLVSGESLLRNLEMGLARARALGGWDGSEGPPPVGHLPDQFGHVGQMPQILSRAGIEHAVLWRGVPSAIEQTSFWWEGPDGSRVLAEYLPFGYSLGAHLREAVEPEALAQVLTHAVQLLAPLSGRDRALIMVGGDHHGPDPSLAERLVATAPLVPDIDARIGSLVDHLDGGPPEGEVPVWRGELRSAHRAHLLPNVYSNRVHQKRERARVESLLERYAEPLAALVPGIRWPEEELERAWTLMLWNGAHDSVCGCSVDQVARDVDGRYAEARGIAEGIAGSAMEAVAAGVGGTGTLRFNPSSFEREGVPGLGWRVVDEPVEPVFEPVDVTVEGTRVMVDGVGLRFVDEPDVGDLYTFCPAEDATPAEPRSIQVSGSEVRASFDDMDVRFRATRRDGEPFVRLDGVVENRRSDHRLRLHVELAVPAERSVAGSPFELVERGLASEGGSETPSPNWPARGLVMAGGRAVLAEGVFEYELFQQQELAVTLLRCVGTISRGKLATRNWGAGPDIATPDGQMIGETAFSLAVIPAATRGALLEAWERFALPILESPTHGGTGELGHSGTLLEVSGDGELSTVRRRAGRLEVRLWNPRREEVQAVVGGWEVPLGPAAIVDVVVEGAA